MFDQKSDTCLPLSPLIDCCRAVAEVLVQIGYGDTLSKDQKKELLEANRIALKYTLESNTTGLVLLLDVAPFRALLFPRDTSQLVSTLLLVVRFYPRWLPGGNFRNWTAYCKKFVEYIRYHPWESVLQDMVRLSAVCACLFMF
jgi:hypothetical protein